MVRENINCEYIKEHLNSISKSKLNQLFFRNILFCIFNTIHVPINSGMIKYVEKGVNPLAKMWLGLEKYNRLDHRFKIFRSRKLLLVSGTLFVFFGLIRMGIFSFRFIHWNSFHKPFTSTAILDDYTIQTLYW